jgi:hypothetical protein
MIPYLDRSTELAYGFPYRFKQATAHCFLVPANYAKLTGLCTRYLNEPSGGKALCLPAMPTLLLAFIHYPWATPTLPVKDPPGSFSYNELAVWMLVADAKRNLRRKSLDPRDALMWFLPAVYVDDPYALIAGREIYGFPKALAQVAIPPAPGTLAVDVPVLLPAGASAPRTRRLVEAEAKAGAVAPDGKEWPMGKCPSAQALLDSGGVKGAVSATLKDMLKDVMKDVPFFDLFSGTHLVCLKQFRDGADVAAACHQRLVEIEPNIRVTGGAPLCAYNVRLFDLEHDRLREDLGLDKAQDSVASFTMQFDMELGAATELE